MPSNKRRDPKTRRFAKAKDPNTETISAATAEATPNPTPTNPSPVSDPAQALSRYRALGEIQVRTQEERAIFRAGVFGTVLGTPGRVYRSNSLPDQQTFQPRQSTLPLIISSETSEDTPEHRIKSALTSSTFSIPAIGRPLPQPTVSPLTPPTRAAVAVQPLASPTLQIARITIPSFTIPSAHSDMAPTVTEAGPSTRPNLPEGHHEIEYSKNRYKQDAAAVHVLKAELDEGRFLHLAEALTEGDALVA